MMLKDVPFRWLIKRPVMIDLRGSPDLYEEFQTDGLVLCLWIDMAGFLRAAAVAAVSLENEPHVEAWYQKRVLLEEVITCQVLLGIHPKEEEQERIWAARKIISERHPTPERLIPVRNTAYLDRFRVPENPDTLKCFSESEHGGRVLVHADGFSGTELLGTVVKEDSRGILHKNDKVMIYTYHGIHSRKMVLIATKARYE